MPGPAVSVLTTVFRLSRGLRTSLDQAFSAVDLTSQQAGVLIHVFGGESSPKALAGLLGTDTAGITRMLDRLETKRLLRRRPDQQDRRAVRVELTDAGRSLVPSLPPIFDKVANQVLAGLDDSQVQQALGTMLANLDNEAPTRLR